MRQKQTNKFDSYIDFLNSLTKKYNIVINTSNKRLELYNAIKLILEKRARGERIPLSDYDELKQYDCPERSLVELFSNPNVEIDEECICYIDDDDYLAGCPNTTCDICWKNYVNDLAEAINNTHLLIKNTDEE